MGTQRTRSVGIVGARGHTGVELIKLIAAHDGLELVFVSSRALAGQRVDAHASDFVGNLCFEALDAGAVAQKKADVVLLALPNGKTEPFVIAINMFKPDTLIVDLSADFRFDPTWFYGLPELYRGNYRGERRIANPGCYATAMQLAIAPLKSFLAAPPTCFGVSGYSGAGTTPSDKNDPEKLRDNLIPYSLVNHTHEREVTRHSGVPVEFMPHVAAHFRGITLTANLWLMEAVQVEAIRRIYRERYANEALIEVVDAPPWVSHAALKHGVQIGGFEVAPGGKRVVVVAVLDNLLKGAATQAVQNINIALGFPELKGIEQGIERGLVYG